MVLVLTCSKPGKIYKMCTVCHGTKQIQLLISTVDCHCVSAEPTLCAPEYDTGVNAFGNRYWKVDGKHHRLDGPALIAANGTRWWLQNDKLHRTTGPAIEYIDGGREYYIEGKCLSHNEYIRAGGT